VCSRVWFQYTALYERIDDLNTAVIAVMLQIFGEEFRQPVFGLSQDVGWL
jgi:hypothetical protein